MNSSIDFAIMHHSHSHVKFYYNNLEKAPVTGVGQSRRMTKEVVCGLNDGRNCVQAVPPPEKDSFFN